MSKEGNIVKFRDELMHTLKYLKLQQERFIDKFDIDTDIDESVYALDVLRLILQPIVENAIYHGLENIKDKGIINISAKRVETFFNIYVNDTGLGIPEDELIKINNLLVSYQPGENLESKMIGIFNVNARIKYYFGTEYGLKISSVYRKGTTVKICLPAMVNDAPL